jgi:polygalacturonase
MKNRITIRRISLNVISSFSLIFFTVYSSMAEMDSGSRMRTKVIIVSDSTSGFIGDGKTDNTRALQNAIDSCYNSGGGTVKLINGIYMTGPITLRSNVTLQVDSGATLLGTPNFKAYYPAGADTSLPMPSSLQPLIAASNADSITITGTGIIDGNGKPWWDAYNNGSISVRPRLIQLKRCTNVTIENISLQNSPQFHVSLQYCWYVTVTNVSIFAPDWSPNTDGIDPATSHFVKILNCKINTGDDNVALKSGSYDPTNPNAGTSNIVVSGCTFLHGHGMSIGSETNGGVDSVFVSDCTFDSTDNGLRIKSYRGAGGNVRNIVYKNIRMKNVKHPIWFSEYYPSIPSPSDPAQPVNSLTPYFHNIIIDSLTADSGSTSSPGCVIVGVPEMPLKDIVLKDVNVSGTYGLLIRNATVYAYHSNFNATSGASITNQVNGVYNSVLISNGTGGGEWNFASTWRSNKVPDSTDYVAIMGGDSVFIPSNEGVKCSSIAILPNGVVNVSAPLSVTDTFSISDNASYYNSCGSCPSFPSAQSYVVSNLSNYIQTAFGDSILGYNGYSSVFGNVVLLRGLTVMGTSLSINGNLTLNGVVVLGQNNLIAKSIIGGSQSSYIITDGHGVLKIPNVGTVQTVFPVGTTLSYSPVWIKNVGTPDTFYVAATIDTNSAVRNDGRVQIKWTIGESSPGKGNCTLQFGWMASAEDSNFAANRDADAKIFYIADSVTEAGTGNYTTQFASQPFWVARGGITNFGDFGIGKFTATAVIREKTTGPSYFQLFQNYPNPFNPTSVINYHIPVMSNVTLKVYDILGREIATLVDSRQSAGDYSAIFDASKFSSGVYLYRLTAGNYSAVRKMVVIR